MSYSEEKNGCWCHSDINIIAALINENSVMRSNGEVDVARRLPPIEFDHAYVKAFDVVEPVPRDDPRPKDGYLLYQNEGEQRPGQRVVTRPVVMFALKPYKGLFALHRKKKRLWFKGRLWVPPHYAVDHRVLLEQVPVVLGEYWQKMRREGNPRMKKDGASHIIMDTVAPTEREDVEDVRVVSEDSRPEAR